VQRGRPTLIDQLALAEPQAGDADDPEDGAAVEAPDAPPDRPSPSLEALVTWVVREVLAAQTRPAGPPADPFAGWERFAADHLEWSPDAAVEVDRLYVSYAHWCGAHGEPVLAEEPVLAALQAKGASLRTGAPSQTALVVGVRVTA
jgi:hypothetical protein